MDGQLVKLEAGDVLLSDRLPLAVTASGLVGNVELRVLGSNEILSARLENRAVCVSQLPVSTDSRYEARESVRNQTSESVDIVIARRALSFSDLARVITGAPLQLDEVPMDPVLVLQDGTLRAQGCLVVRRGELGVRITHLY
jgi:flagellar motor switch/type III secretory pathway protein FliN